MPGSASIPVPLSTNGWLCWQEAHQAWLVVTIDLAFAARAADIVPLAPLEALAAAED
jgi:hypothetical protein